MCMLVVLRKYDTAIAFVCCALIVAFIGAAFTVPSFWDWLWQRHQNQLSWYIRPLFLIPLWWFAYKRSGAGIMATVLLLLTSMGWFPPPRQVSPRVQQFLQFEQQYLQGPPHGHGSTVVGGASGSIVAAQSLARSSGHGADRHCKIPVERGVCG